MKHFKLLFLSFAALFCGGLRDQFCTANGEGAAGTHHQNVTKLADAGFSYRHLFVKAGTDADHVNVCGATDVPIGITDDQPNAAGDPIQVAVLGISERTRLAICTTALGNEIDLYVGANGYAIALPATAGTYYKVGRSKQAAQPTEVSNIYEIEFEPCSPQKTIVIAHATGTAATDIAALYTALQSGPAVIMSLAS